MSTKVDSQLQTVEFFVNITLEAQNRIDPNFSPMPLHPSPFHKWLLLRPQITAPCTQMRLFSPFTGQYV